MIDANATLADLAITRPGASQVFMSYGLDFCCHGRRPLGEACLEKGLDPGAVLAEIEAADSVAVPLTPWANRPLDELVGFIETHYHARLRAELPRVVAMAGKVEQVHADKRTCPRGLFAHLDAMRSSLLEHADKEEQSLFPVIREGRGAIASGSIHSLEHEHEDLGRALARVREITSDLTPPGEACTTWRALYLALVRLEAELMEHIHLENNVLFPRALCA